MAAKHASENNLKANPTSFRKIRLESKWKTTFWLVLTEISGSNGTSEKVVLYVCLFFLDEIFQTKPSLTPVPRLRGRFSVNETDLYKW